MDQQQRSGMNNTYFTNTASEEVFHQGGDIQDLSNLMQESLNHGLLDCGAVKTVAGSLWYDIFLQSLPKGRKEGR